MSRKKILAAIFVLTLMAFFVWMNLKPKTSEYETVQVQIGSITQEISESGIVKKGDLVNLNFKGSGLISKIDVEVGQNVKKGDTLVELDRTQLLIQLREAQNNFNLASLSLSKLLNGASPEEIKISATRVANAKETLSSSQTSLSDIQTSADESLNNAYEDALDSMDSAYIKAYNAKNVVDEVHRTYFASPRDEDSIKVFEDKEKITSLVAELKTSLDSSKNGVKQNKIEEALAVFKINLSAISNLIKEIRDICEKSLWRSIVSSTYKTSLDTQRDYVNTSLAGINTSSQTVSSTRITNDYNVNTAKAVVIAAEGQLKTAQDEYSRLTAPPRQEDIDIAKIQVSQAQSAIELIQSQLDDAVLRSPIDGQIAKINREEGETISQLASEGLIQILPQEPYRLEVDIYEEDVVKMNVGNPVEIELVAFPGQKFSGEVISIEPAEKMVAGVVYYTTDIAFDDPPEGLKTGMSADIIIKALTRENVLILPEKALEKRGSEYFAKVIEDSKINERAVKIGIKDKGSVEIMSGLKEGESIIVPN